MRSQRSHNGVEKQAISLSDLPQLVLSGERLQQRIEAFNFQGFYDQVDHWLQQRPLLRWADQRTSEIRSLIVGEIEEFLIELVQAEQVSKQSNLTNNDFLGKEIRRVIHLIQSKPGETIDGVAFDAWYKVFAEAMDQIFFLMGHAASRQIVPDFDTAHRYINGQGARSGVPEMLAILADDIGSVAPHAAMQEYLTLWGSFMAHMEMFVDPNYVLARILRKNGGQWDGNYPAVLFQETQIITDAEGSYREVALEEDERELSFNHRVRCLRLIRRALELAEISRTHGLEKDDYLRYVLLILNHRNPAAVTELASQLVLHLGEQGRRFTYTQLLQVEQEPHRVVPGARSLEIIIFSSSTAVV